MFEICGADLEIFFDLSPRICLGERILGSGSEMPHYRLKDTPGACRWMKPWLWAVILVISAVRGAPKR